MSFDEGARRHGDPGSLAGPLSPNPRAKNRFERLQEAMETRRIDTNELVEDAFEDDIDHAVFDFERLPQLLEEPTSDTTRSPQPTEDVTPPPERHRLDEQIEARDQGDREPTASMRVSDRAARPARPPLVPRLMNTQPADILVSHTLPPAADTLQVNGAGGAAAHAAFSHATTLLDLEVGELASDEVEVSDPELERPELAWDAPEPQVLSPQPEGAISRGGSTGAQRRALPPPPALAHRFGTARRRDVGTTAQSRSRGRERSPWLLTAKVLGYVLLAVAAGVGLRYLTGM